MKVINSNVNSDKELATAQEIICKIEENKFDDVTQLLYQLTEKNKFPKDWIQATRDALKTGDWSLLSQRFIRKEFVGPDGYFLLIAPNKLSEAKGGSVELCALLGKVLAVDIISVCEIEDEAFSIFGKLNQSITEIIPFISIFSCDCFRHEDSEAFIVPESWIIPCSIQGPSLNNMTQHRRRFNEIVHKNIPCIFEPATADLLLDSLADEAIGLERQHIEYQYHDAGHATGIGIKDKVKNKLFPSYWYAAIEEWRSDGVEFDLAYRTLPMEEVGKLVAANFCLRFGIDAQRSGGINGDAHATSSLITLEYLFRSAALCFKKGKLALRNPTLQGLLKATKLQCTEAVCLTQEELSLEHHAGLFGCYQSINVHQSTKQIFQEFVKLSPFNPRLNAIS